MPSPTESQADSYEEFMLVYLRLLHDYEKLRYRYEHARAAIENDLWLEQELARREELVF